MSKIGVSRIHIAIGQATRRAAPGARRRDSLTGPPNEYKYIYIYIYTHTHIHIHIHIHIHRERERSNNYAKGEAPRRLNRSAASGILRTSFVLLLIVCLLVCLLCVLVCMLYVLLCTVWDTADKLGNMVRSGTVQRSIMAQY